MQLIDLVFELCLDSKFPVRGEIFIFTVNSLVSQTSLLGEVPLVVVANELASDIVVSEFELQSHNYIHFRTNTLDKSITRFTHLL